MIYVRNKLLTHEKCVSNYCMITLVNSLYN